MTIGFKIQIVNGKEIAEAIKKFGAEKIAKANDAVHDAGFMVEDEIHMSIAGRRDEPTSVDTGAFQTSVRTNNSRFLISEVFTPLDYPIFLEYGTSKIEPRRHFGNSLARKYDDINNKIKVTIK